MSIFVGFKVRKGWTNIFICRGRFEPRKNLERQSNLRRYEDEVEMI